MSDDSFDNSPLDLSTLEADLIAPVMRRVQALPARPPIGPLWGLWSLSRELAIAGALTMVVLLALTQPWKRASPPRADTVAESIGVPPEFLDLLARQGERR